MGAFSNLLTEVRHESFEVSHVLSHVFLILFKSIMELFGIKKI